MTSFITPSPSSTKKVAPLIYVLVFASILFIGILIAVYFITKHSNPIMLDEHGKAIATASFLNSDQEGLLERT